MTEQKQNPTSMDHAAMDETAAASRQAGSNPAETHPSILSSGSPLSNESLLLNRRLLPGDTTSGCGIVLAAGASTRMGSIKALLPVSENGPNAVRHLAQQFLRIVSHCVVVTGFHPAEVTASVSDLPGLHIARNPQPEDGQLSSLQTGIRAALQLNREHSSQASGSHDAPVQAWLLFAPVDCMGIEESVMDALAAGMRIAAPETLCLQPRFQDRRGHPFGFRAACAARFLELSPKESARTIVHALRPDTQYIEIDHDRFLWDIDRPEDYAQMLVAGRRQQGSGV